MYKWLFQRSISIDQFNFKTLQFYRWLCSGFRYAISKIDDEFSHFPLYLIHFESVACRASFLLAKVPLITFVLDSGSLPYYFFLYYRRSLADVLFVYILIVYRNIGVIRWPILLIISELIAITSSHCNWWQILT